MSGTNLLREIDGGSILVTGGAGFVGTHLAIALAGALPRSRVVAFDSLCRRGSDLNVPRLQASGVSFVRGDVADLEALTNAATGCRLLVECAAEASASAGYGRSPRAVTTTNVIGMLNCLEVARTTGAAFVFLSTSRVYPIEALNAIAVTAQPTRWTISPEQRQPGVSGAGISEQFTLSGIRTLYGATKLASELLLAEYGAMYDLPYVINRFGVITGPGQMGAEEQGVFALWVARHHFSLPLTYRGWGGDGRQVRDLLHVDDVSRLILCQLEQWNRVAGRTYNVGGGAASTLSLVETTALCREITGREVPVGSEPATHPSDVRLYVTDNGAVARDTGWQPTHDPRAILEDIHQWIRANDEQLAPVFRGR